MRIFITQEDIDKGQKSNCYECPIAQSLKRKGSHNVAVFDGSIWMAGEEFITPLNVDDFIRAFDAGKPVQPFSFEL